MREIYTGVHLIISLKIKFSLLNISFLLKSFGSYVVYTEDTCVLFELIWVFFNISSFSAALEIHPGREGEELELHWSVKITDQRLESTFSLPPCLPPEILHPITDQRVPSLYPPVYLYPHPNLLCQNTAIQNNYSCSTILQKCITDQSTLSPNLFCKQTATEILQQYSKTDAKNAS